LYAYNCERYQKYFPCYKLLFGLGRGGSKTFAGDQVVDNKKQSSRRNKDGNAPLQVETECKKDAQTHKAKLRIISK